MIETNVLQDAVGTFKYIKWLDLYKKEKPFQIFIDIPKTAPDQRFTNLSYEEREETFRDVRGQEESFTLNDHGFATTITTSVSTTTRTVKRSKRIIFPNWKIFSERRSKTWVKCSSSIGGYDQDQSITPRVSRCRNEE